MLSELYVLCAFLSIFIYFQMIETTYGKEHMTRKDPLNQRLFEIPFIKVPVCGWSISHILAFYMLTGVIDKIEKNKTKRNLFVIASGIVWYMIQDRLFHESSKGALERDGAADIVYKNVYKPRADDLLFNGIGQLIYILRHDLK